MADKRTPDSSTERPCVGRALGLAAINAQFDLALQGESSLCHVNGDAGSGKSTLLRAGKLAYFHASGLSRAEGGIDGLVHRLSVKANRCVASVRR